MSASPRAVLGFEHDGRVGFCCTTAPLVYLQRLCDGAYRSQYISAGATLRWALRTSDHQEGIRLRDLLNHSDREEAIAIADRHTTPAATVVALRALALQHGEAIAEGRLDAGHEQAWRLLEESADNVVVIDEPTEEGEEGDSDAAWVVDCPFAPLPEVGCGRDDVEVWADLSAQSFRLAIFDLDGTLLDTSALDDARAARDWGWIEDNLDQVRAFPVWGLRAPHELVAELQNHGKQVAVVTRAPRWYADALLDAFDIAPDHVIAASGADKTAGFHRAVRAAGCQRLADTVVFGDDAADFRAAKEIGAWTLGNPWANLAMIHHTMPDIAWWDAETLLAADDWRPTLGYVGEAVDGHPCAWHRGSLVPIGPDAWALGRYFPTHHRRHKQALSQAVLAQKETSNRVERIAEGFDEVIRRLTERIDVDAVTSVPGRDGQVDRFAAYRRTVHGHTGAVELSVVTGREVPPYYKRMTKAQRRELREGRFSVDEDLSGCSVLVLDDVINTGSTIGALCDAVRDAGAKRVLQLAFAANQRS